MKSGPLVVLIGAALLAAAACVTAVILFILPPQTLPPLPDLLTHADESLARAYHEEAARAVSLAGLAARTPEEMLRVLKRHYLLARATGDFKAFREYALRAVQRYPGQAALDQAALYACLRARDTGEAESLSRAARPLPAVQSLRAELLLERPRAADDPSLASIPLYSRSRSLARRPDPAQLLTAGRELDDARYYLDAALLSMEQGHARDAHDIASRRLLTPAFDEPAGLFAYDFGDFRAAAARLSAAARSAKARPDLWIIAGDSLRAAGDAENAAALYARAIRSVPSYSPYPYLVLARLAMDSNRPEEAFRRLEEALTLFPADKTVLAPYAEAAYARGEREKARQALSAYLAVNPDDAEMQFLNLTYAADTLSTERLLTRLREFYFEHPDNEAAARMLVAALFADRDAAGVRTILLHYRERNPDEERAWLSSARGLLEAWNGDLTEAIDSLTEAVRLEDGFTARYNLSVALIAAGRPEEAETGLRQALAFLKDRPPDFRQAALAHTRLAAVYASQGDMERARRDLATALHYDPDNAEAFRLKRSLGAAGSR